MEYSTPLLRVVGTAQSLVLGGGINMTRDNVSDTTSPVLEVLGLDD